MIESCGALDALDDILSTDGIDAVLIGPYDLSASLGCTGDFGQPRFTAAMEAIRAAAQRHQVAPGIHVVAPDIEQLRTRVSDDFRFIAYSLDAVMLASAARRPNP
jgi:2-dehydro-3-deoxyglucarate aldolase